VPFHQVSEWELEVRRHEILLATADHARKQKLSSVEPGRNVRTDHVHTQDTYCECPRKKPAGRMRSRKASLLGCKLVVEASQETGRGDGSFI
jgi:hypothetical protein